MENIELFYIYITYLPVCINIIRNHRNELVRNVARRELLAFSSRLISIIAIMYLDSVEKFDVDVRER